MPMEHRALGIPNTGQFVTPPQAREQASPSSGRMPGLKSHDHRLDMCGPSCPPKPGQSRSRPTLDDLERKLNAVAP